MIRASRPIPHATRNSPSRSGGHRRPGVVRPQRARAEVDRPLRPVADRVERRPDARGCPSADASTFPVPPGRSRAGRVRPTSAEAASRMVPSPPTATTSGDPASRASRDRGLGRGQVAVDDPCRSTGPRRAPRRAIAPTISSRRRASVSRAARGLTTINGADASSGRRRGRDDPGSWPTDRSRPQRPDWRRRHEFGDHGLDFAPPTDPPGQMGPDNSRAPRARLVESPPDIDPSLRGSRCPRHPCLSPVLPCASVGVRTTAVAPPARCRWQEGPSIAHATLWAPERSSPSPSRVPSSSSSLHPLRSRPRSPGRGSARPSRSSGSPGHSSAIRGAMAPPARARSIAPASSLRVPQGR